MSDTPPPATTPGPPPASPLASPTPPPYRPEPRRRWLLPAGLAAAVVAVVVGGIALSGGFAGAPDGTPGPSAPGPIPAEPSIVAEGRVLPARGLQLSIAVPGVVTAIPVEEGAAVASGAVLLQLDTTAADAEVAAAEAAVTGAMARVEQARAGVTQAQEAVAGADAGVDQASAARSAAIAARDALPSGASSALKRQAQAEINRATAAVEVARAQLRSAQAGVTAAQQALVAAEAEAARVTAGLAAAEAARDQLAIRAPWAGVALAIDAEIGERVQAGVPLVRFMDPAAGWRFETSDLSETSVARVLEGAAAVVTVDALPDAEIRATIASIGTFGTFQQGDVVFRVVAEPAGEVPDGLRWNMTVTIEIATEE